jgi:RNA polymerase sigma-70 factor (ECF subfamily)
MQRDLVERARAGDQAAFAELVPAMAQRLLAVAYRILRDADLAEDATQQALLTAWRKLPTLQDLDRFEAWSYRLVVHSSYAEARRQSRWTQPHPMQAQRGVPDDTAGVIDRDRLDRGFRRLSLNHRSVVVLHHYVGLPLTDIAELLGVPFGTVRSRLHYAIRALRDSIGRDDADGDRR